MKALAVLGLVSACYGSAPPPPTKIPLPPVVEGATIEVQSEDKTTMEEVERQAKTCPTTGDPGNCAVTKYTETVPVTRTYSTASYGGRPINYAQLRVLGDAEYDAKVARLAELSHVCRRANIPRYLGLAGLVGGAIVANIGASGDNPNRVVEVAGFVAIAGGIAAYATGYYAFGGRDCVEAATLHDEIELGRKQWETVTGADYAAEMKELARKFNHERHTMGMR